MFQYVRGDREQVEAGREGDVYDDAGLDGGRDRLADHVLHTVRRENRGPGHHQRSARGTRLDHW